MRTTRRAEDRVLGRSRMHRNPSHAPAGPHAWFVSAIFVLLLASATTALGAQQATAAPPTLILTGAKVFTADSARPWAEAVAIRGERIIAVGSSNEIGRLAVPTTRRLDLAGRVVVPGFNDAHTHLGCWNSRARWVPTPGEVMPDPTFASLGDSLRALATREPAGTWLAAQIGPTVMDDSGARRAALDRIAPRHAVMLFLFGGHGAILNSAAMRVMGIDETTSDRVGGYYEREPGSRRLNGAAREYAVLPIRRRFCSAEPESALVRALQANGRWLLARGVTSFQNFNNELDPALGMRVFRAARLPQRVRIVPMPFTSPSGRALSEWKQVLASGPSGPNAGGGTLTVSGVKWLLDGTPIERGAAHRSAYRDRPSHFGALDFPPDTIGAFLLEARDARQQPLLHAGGDSAIAVLLDRLEHTGGAPVWRPLRVRIEHGDALLPDLLERARRLGIIVVQNPTHFGLPELMHARYDSTTAAGFQPMRSLVTAGIPLAIGADAGGSGDALSPFVNIMLATVHPTNPNEALTREQAVTAYTRGSAYAEMAEREKGTLAAGMLADLAVLSQDIFVVPTPQLPATTSVLTLIGGRIVHDELTGASRSERPASVSAKAGIAPLP